MNAVLEAIMENRDMNLKNIKGVALQQLKRVEPQWEMIIKQFDAFSSEENDKIYLDKEQLTIHTPNGHYRLYCTERIHKYLIDHPSEATDLIILNNGM